MFNLSSVHFKIADKSDKEKLIEFVVKQWHQQKTRFTALSIDADQAYLSPVFFNLISNYINKGICIIAMDSNGHIIAHGSMKDYKSEMHDYVVQHNPIRRQHGAELMKIATNNLFTKYSIDQQHIKPGEYLHCGVIAMDPKYSKTGLLNVMYSFCMVFCYKLGYKYIFGLSTTTRTFTTSSRRNKNRLSNAMHITADFDYSDHVFEDGTKMQDYIDRCVDKYGDDRNELIKTCVAQAQRASFRFPNFGIVQTMIKMLWYNAYKKHSNKSKL